MKKASSFIFFSVVLSLIVSASLIGCGPSADSKVKMKEECAKTAVESGDKCKECCEKAGYTGYSFMSSFMTGDKATCECM